MAAKFTIPGTTYIGDGALAAAGSDICALGTKALIVTGQSMIKQGFMKVLTDILEQNGVGYVIDSQISGEPTDVMIEEGLLLYQENACDFIIGFGGGSPLDSAKAIGAMVTNPGKISDYNGKVIQNPIPPLAAIPSTAGTGSEVTQFTIISDTKNQIKMLLKGSVLLPDIAVVDPQFTMSTPKSVTAATGLDALTHAVEAYTSKKATAKDAALEKFKITFQKQRLWNEVLKIEKNADAQLGRSFEFSLPKEWSRQEQIDYTTEYIQKTFVDKGMCVDWSIHDKGDGNPHVHLLVTMRPFNLDHSWGSKEVKDWDFVRDTDGNIVVDESHPDWWQDKKNPDRHGIRIPVLDENGVQKVGARNRKQWKRVLTDATGWNNPKNCELWRSEWAGMCNRHLSIDNQIDHRSYERQGKLKIPTIHEGADARKIEEKYLTGQIWNGSWKVEENQMIKKQNALLQKVITTFGKVSGALSIWKEWLNDIRRKQRSNSHDGSNDYTDRGTAEYHGRDASGDTGKGREADVLSGAGRTIAAIRERIVRAATNLTGYRRTVDASGRKDRPDTETHRRKSAMAGIGTEIKQREPAIAETEQRITELEQQLEKGRLIDERIKKLKERRSTGRVASADRADAGRTRPERQDYPGTENAARRIADLEREVKQREQSREHSSLKERLEENKRIVAERERENARCRNHDRGMSR